MATTHALAGVALAVVVSLAVPEAAGLPLLAAAVGGLFPDVDLLAAHRRTLHYPVYYTAAATPAVLLAAVTPTTLTLAVALFLLAAALHSVMDAAGGGLEPRPWLATSDRAVYDHYRGRWVPPRRWVRYDGAPEDLLLAVVVALPALAVLDGWPRAAVVGALVLSAGYVLLRKPLVAAAAWAVPRLPDTLFRRLPAPLASLVVDFR